MCIDPRFYNPRVERLCNIIHRPQDQPILLVLNVSQTGDQDHRYTLGNDLLLQLFQQRKTVHPRHHDIQQDQGIIFSAGKAKPLLRRMRGGDLILILQNFF